MAGHCHGHSIFYAGSGTVSTGGQQQSASTTKAFTGAPDERLQQFPSTLTYCVKCEVSCCQEGNDKRG
jgi:hypothetical protein